MISRTSVMAYSEEKFNRHGDKASPCLRHSEDKMHRNNIYLYELFFRFHLNAFCSISNNFMIFWIQWECRIILLSWDRAFLKSTRIYSWCPVPLYFLEVHIRLIYYSIVLSHFHQCLTNAEYLIYDRLLENPYWQSPLISCTTWVNLGGSTLYTRKVTRFRFYRI